MRKRIPIFYSAILLTMVNLLLRLVSTSFQVYLSRRIGAEGIGLVQLVLSVSAMGITAGIAGVRTATMYLSAEEIGRKQDSHVPWILSGCLKYSILCSGAVAAMLYFSSPKLSALWIGNPDTRDALRLFAVFLPVTCLSCVLSGLFTAAGQILTLAVVEIGEQIVSMAVTMSALIFWAGHSAPRAAMAVILGSGIGSCVTLTCLVCIRLRSRQAIGQRIPVAKRLFSSAVPLALADDLKSCISTTEHLMVPKRLALFPAAVSPLGMFGMILGMVFPIVMFPAAILFGLAELLIPELARCNAAGSGRRIHYLTHRSLRVALIYGVCCGGLIFLLAENLCVGLYKTADPTPYLRLFACVVPMLYCDAITDAIIKGLGQQKVSVRYNILTSAMDVAFLYFLLPKYGLQGYFFSFLITHLVNFTLSLRRLLIITNEKIPFFIPCLTVSCAVFSVWVCSHAQRPVMRAAGFLPLLFSLLFLCRVLQKDDILWIRGMIKKSPAKMAGEENL